MASCRSCSDRLPDAARFCSGCGAPAGTSSAGESIELIGSSSSVIESDVQGGGWRTRIYAVVAVVVAGLLGWSMLSASAESDGSQSELAQGEADSDEEDEEADSSRPNGGATTSFTGTTSRRSTTESTQAEDEPGPVLGEPVGLSVFFGSDSGRLRRVNLDNGEIDEFELRAMPVYADGEWLVLMRRSSGELQVVNANDVDGGSRPLGEAGFFWPGGSVTAGPEQGQVWVRGPDFEEPEWLLYDLATSELLRRVPALISFFGPASTSGPEVVGAPSGGVFELQGDDYVRVADGQAVAISDDFVLRQTCTDPVNCEISWISRDDWEAVDRLVPPDQIQAAWLSPDGRLLAFYTPQGPQVLDVETGSSIPGFQDQAEGIGFSPDGRFIVQFTHRLHIRSLDTGEDFYVTARSPSGWGNAVFVENR